MSNRFWGVWMAGEANTLNRSGLGSALRALTSPCLVQGSSLLHPQPLCVPQGHRADSSWPLAEWVALSAKIHCQNWHLDLPGASWLLPGTYCSRASLLVAAQARLELLDVPFILLEPSGLMGQMYVCVCALCSPSCILFCTVMTAGSETDLFT